MIHNLVAKILESYGYTTEIINEYIIGHKNRLSVIIGVITPWELSPIQFLLSYIQFTKNMDGRKVVVSVRDIEPDVERIANENQITLWHKSAFQTEIGRMVLNHILSASVPTSRSASLQGKCVNSLVEKLISEGGSPNVSVVDNTINIYSEKIVTPKVTLDEIRKTTRVLGGYAHELKFVPYYVYGYSCEVINENTLKTDKRSGLIGVNTLTKKCEIFLEDYEIVYEIDIPYTKLDSKISEEEAYEIAKYSVIEFNTTEEEYVIDKGGAIIIGKRRIRPRGRVEIISKGLIYLPLWYVECSKGTIIINAVDKKIVHER